MVKKIFLLACLFSSLFTVTAMAASSKAKLITDTSSSANTVPFINAGPAEDSTAATALSVQVGGTEMMRVTASGFVGIGTTTPTRPLSVVGSGSIGSQQLHLGLNGSNGLFLVGSSNSTHYNWLIGEQYNVDTAIEFTPSTTVGGTSFSSPAFKIYKSGAATLAGALTQNSDIRLKKEIAPLKGVLAKLQNIHGVTFYWIEENREHGQQIGVIAQDVQKAFPELVRKDEQGMLTVNYPALVSPLIEGVKQLDAARGQTDERLEKVEAENDALRARLEKLEARVK